MVFINKDKLIKKASNEGLIRTETQSKKIRNILILLKNYRRGVRVRALRFISYNTTAVKYKQNQSLH